MNWIRSNIVYAVLALVAVGLVFLTVRLQNLVQIAQTEVGSVPAVPPASATALPTATPFPSPTPFPTATPFPTTAPPTVRPSPTPIPVLTAAPTEPPTPTAEPAAVQASAPEPEELLEIEILGATNLTTSEDDSVLVGMIKDNPRAVGFIRYSSYQANQDLLRAVKIQTSSGAVVEPSEETVASGAYPFSRPLLLYAALDEVTARPHLEGYIGCYLNRVFGEIEAIGYTPPSVAMYREALENFKASCQRCQMSTNDNPLFPEIPACSADGIAAAPVVLTGGSTVYPLSARMIDLYREVGFPGEITIEDIGTSAGFERFCERGEADIVNASRLIRDREEAACQSINRNVRGFPVGLDLVVVVVSQQNEFVEQLSFDQLRLLFTNAIRWSELNPAWPVEPIVRAIPNKSRGTFTFFVEELYANSSAEPVAVAQAAPVANVSAPPTPTTAPTAPISDSDPRQLLLGAENVTSSQDDNLRVAIIRQNSRAIGFVGNAVYSRNIDGIRALALQLDNGQIVEPNQQSVFDGSYPLARPLYIYLDAATFQEKPDVQAFMGCFLNKIHNEIGDQGFFPANESLFRSSLQEFDRLCPNCAKVPSNIAAYPEVPACPLAGIVNGTVNIAGSTTMAPLTEHMVNIFKEQGFTGVIRVDAIGSGAGLKRFCEEGTEDIITSDRPINEQEIAQCQSINRAPVGFVVGADAMSIVVSRQNTFVNAVTLSELRSLFSTARYWSDIQSEWPGELVQRVIPSEQSGSFDFFVKNVFESSTLSAPSPVAAAPDATSAPPPTVAPTATPTSPPVAIPVETDTPEPDADYVFGYLTGRPACKFATDVVVNALTREYGLRVKTVEFDRADTLYAQLAHQNDQAGQIDFTLCYLYPDDNSYLVEHGSLLKIFGSDIARNQNQRWYVVGFSGHYVQMKTNLPCVFEMLQEKLDFADMQFSEPDVATWIQNHQTLYSNWTTCS